MHRWNNAPVVCPHCGAEFEFFILLDAHIIDKHPDIDRERAQ